MATIGVTRGFGDHDLVSVHQRIPIKPFLSCHPEVQVYDLKDAKRYDVLVMGTDGLWDVIDGLTVAHTVNEAVQIFEEKEVYISAATCLVGAARGSSKDQQWVLKSGKAASVDDISVFVIPLHQINKDYKRMLKTISLRLPITLPDDLLNDNENIFQNGTAGAVGGSHRHSYLSSVVETIKEKQRYRKESKHSDLCFVTTDKTAGGDYYKSENTLNLNVGGNLPKDDFLLVNVQSIDSIDVLECNNHLGSLKLDESAGDNPINLKKINLGKTGAVELLLIDNALTRGIPLRSRSFPSDEISDRSQKFHLSRDRNKRQFTRYKLKVKCNEYKSLTQIPSNKTSSSSI